ncbi:hypothetical protein JCM33374_g5142 [Metschnikowia sp. JCM 33374]|nr:hypothetical protein JCM33374_g5142 [Metschnikowia sp. JCM 33374]
MFSWPAWNLGRKWFGNTRVDLCPDALDTFSGVPSAIRSTTLHVVAQKQAAQMSLPDEKDQTESPRPKIIETESHAYMRLASPTGEKAPHVKGIFKELPSCRRSTLKKSVKKIDLTLRLG